MFCLTARRGRGALVLFRTALIWPLVAFVEPRLEALFFFAVVLFDFGLGAVIAESATPDFRLRRSVTLSRAGLSFLRGGVFARISAAVARRPPVVVLGPLVLRMTRFCRPVVFFPDPALRRAGIDRPLR